MIAHFLQFLLIKILKVFFSLFSFNKTAKITAKIAVFIGKFHKSSKIAYINLKTIYPDMSNQEIHSTIEKMWQHLGMNLGEFLKINSLSDNEFLSLIESNEIEKLRSLYEQYGKIIIVSAHFGNWELGPKLCNIYNMPFSLIYRHSNNPLINKEISDIRKKYTSNLFNKGVLGTKALIKSIKTSSKLIVCMLIDQKLNNGVELDFMGHKAMTSTAPAELSIKYNMPIVIAAMTRSAPGVSKFIMNITDIISPNEQDPIKLSQNLNNEIAKMINNNKWQWFWVHDRWSFWKNNK